MPNATVRGLNINYEIIGDEGPWAAPITGGRRGYQEFIPIAKRIAGEGNRVLLHDRRNTGASDIKLEAHEVEEMIWPTICAIFLISWVLCRPSSEASSGADRDYVRPAPSLRAPSAVAPAGDGRCVSPNACRPCITDSSSPQLEGGMEAVCATNMWKERIEANPGNRELLKAMDPADFIDIFSRSKELFEAGVHHPVMGVTNEELSSLTMPTIVIPGNDNTHASASGKAAHERIPDSELYDLGLEDEDVALIPYPDWACTSRERRRADGFHAPALSLSG